MNKRVVSAVFALLVFAGCVSSGPKDLPPNMVEVEDHEEWVVTSRRTTLRPEPNVYRRVIQIPPSTRLTVLREIILLDDETAEETVRARRRNEHWYQVQYRLKKGWITMWDTTNAPDALSIQMQNQQQ